MKYQLTCLALLAIGAVTLQAQSGTMIVPASNYVHSTERAVRAHTNILAFRRAGANGTFPEGKHRRAWRAPTVW